VLIAQGIFAPAEFANERFELMFFRARQVGEILRCRRVGDAARAGKVEDETLVNVDGKVVEPVSEVPQVISRGRIALRKASR